MADFILNDLDIVQSNIPIEFDLQFDIDRKKILNNIQTDTILLNRLEEIDYYNLALVDEEFSNNSEENIDLMQEFKTSFEAFSLEKATV